MKNDQMLIEDFVLQLMVSQWPKDATKHALT